MGNIIDISVSISGKMITFPGDPVPAIEPFSGIEEGKSNVSSICLGSHTGTHIDAPRHFLENGKTVDQFPLDRLVGPAKVIDMRGRDKISAKDLKAHQINNGDRILLKTNNSELWGKDIFDSNFVFLTRDAAEYLAEVGIGLVGIDYFSVEEYKSQDCPVHTKLLKSEILILEGLDLSRVQEGEYFLGCLPLKLVDTDGAPARAILMEK